MRLKDVRQKMKKLSYPVKEIINLYLCYQIIEVVSFLWISEPFLGLNLDLRVCQPREPQQEVVSPQTCSNFMSHWLAPSLARRRLFVPRKRLSNWKVINLMQYPQIRAPENSGWSSEFVRNDKCGVVKSTTRRETDCRTSQKSFSWENFPKIFSFTKLVFIIMLCSCFRQAPSRGQWKTFTH